MKNNLNLKKDIVEHATTEHVIEYAKERIENSKKVVIFLDYDGTLTEIVSKPEEAMLSERAKNVIKRLSSQKDTYVGVISGRKLEDVMSRVGIEGIWYAGNHGFDMLIGNKKHEIVNRKLKEVLTKIANKLEDKTRSIDGVIVENKGSVVAFHYRNVEKKRIKEVKNLFMETLRPYVDRGLVNLHRGKKVLEAWPAIRWNKGLAILWFISESRIKPEECTLFYFGDDTTDEDAFKLLNFQRVGNTDNKIAYSIPIFVGNRRKKTNAKFYLKGPNEVISYLEFILDVLNCKNKNKNISIKKV